MNEIALFIITDVGFSQECECFVNIFTCIIITYSCRFIYPVGDIEIMVHSVWY